MGDTIIIEDEKPKAPDVVVVVPESAPAKKVVTEKTVTVTERKED